MSRIDLDIRLKQKMYAWRQERPTQAYRFCPRFSLHSQIRLFATLPHICAAVTFCVYDNTCIKLLVTLIPPHHDCRRRVSRSSAFHSSMPPLTMPASSSRTLELHTSVLPRLLACSAPPVRMSSSMHHDSSTQYLSTSPRLQRGSRSLLCFHVATPASRL